MAQNILNPLAQTFTVDVNDFSSGFFLHSVDLWFKRIDQNIPVKIQIRPLTNGYPDMSSVIPFSDVVVDSDEITVTSSPKLSNATNIVFPTPPLLLPTDYALVVYSDSINYDLFISRLGEYVLHEDTGLPTQRTISAQPYSGVLFKSSNGSTFTSVEEEDLMFRIWRTNFETGTFGGTFNIDFDQDQMKELSTGVAQKSNNEHFHYDPTADTDKFTYNYFKINTVEIKDSSNTTQPTYSFRDRFVIDESFGTSTNALVYKPVIVNDFIERSQLTDTTVGSPDKRTGTGIIEESQDNSFDVKVSFGTSDPVMSPLIDAQEMNVEFIQNLIDELEITTSGNSSNINIKNGGTGFAVGDYLIVYNDDLGTVPALTTTTTTADAAQTGKDGDNPGYLRVSAVSGTITSTGTINNKAFIIGETINQATSSAVGVVTGTSGASTSTATGAGAISYTVTSGTFTATDAHTITGATSTATLGTTITNTSVGAISTLAHPVSAFDDNRARALTGNISIGTVATDGSGINAIVHTTDELEPTGGIAECRYVSKAIQLKKGFESQDIKVTCNAYRPKGTRVYAYYKVKAPEDTDSFTIKPYNRLYELTDPDDFSQETSDIIPLEFVTYKKNSAGDTDQTTVGGTRYTSGGASYEKFNEYAIKIVMTAETTNRVPILDSLGGLALINPIEPAS